MENSELTTPPPEPKQPAPKAQPLRPTKNLSDTASKESHVRAVITEIKPSTLSDDKDQTILAPKNTSNSPNRAQNPTALSQPAPTRKWMIHEKQLDEYGKECHGVSRDFPAPKDNMTIEEMLALPPLPWSPLYRDKTPKPSPHYTQTAKQKTKEFEETKEKLRKYVSKK